MFAEILLISLVCNFNNQIFAYNPNLLQDVKDCVPDCDSKIFCQGDLLHDVQTSRIFSDGTVFVEKQLRYPEKDVIDKYTKLKKKHGGRTPDADTLMKFVDENFANDSLDTCELPDHKVEPSIIDKVDPKYRDWLLRLNEIWLELAGRINKDCKDRPELHSYMYVPNRFIKAGGRFTGTYYWDSYWIIKGLLVCDMHESARGIVENIVYLINKHGHMPNGNRIYYLQRSQPPMLIQMAASYYEATKNATFIRNNLAAFEKEFEWWHKNRAIDVEKDGKKYKMLRYKSISCSPRPESYYEDYELVKNITDEKERARIFTGIRSATESGWDFSSRHMRGPNNSKRGTLRDMDSQNMIYVDLNSIMHSNIAYLSKWHEEFGNKSKAQRYEKIANYMKDSIEHILWNEEAGIWQDFDLITNKHRNFFFASNLTPLWSKSYKNETKIDRAIDYLKKHNIITEDLQPKYYGVPTTTDNTTQQWDFPNCWAPLQSFIIQGLEKSNNPTAERIAYNLARAWIKTAFEGFQKGNQMYEKYSAIELGSSGGGGEYEPQTGFGWTNGFIFDLFNTWRTF
ncbi:trehalase-like [Planococcus citri]|uniref:trehalase-like n=1 Tax=Planococcus citri TaxID=170843 RepID=UPI0031F9BC3C